MWTSRLLYTHILWNVTVVNICILFGVVTMCCCIWLFSSLWSMHVKRHKLISSEGKILLFTGLKMDDLERVTLQKRKVNLPLQIAVCLVQTQSQENGIRGKGTQWTDCLLWLLSVLVNDAVGQSELCFLSAAGCLVLEALPVSEVQMPDWPAENSWPMSDDGCRSNTTEFLHMEMSRLKEWWGIWQFASCSQELLTFCSVLVSVMTAWIC